MANRRIGGTLTITVNGQQLLARGEFSVSGFHPIREGIAGLDEVHGYTENPQVPMIEGSITTGPGFGLGGVQGIEDATVVLAQANGSVYSLTEAWETAEGAVNTGDGSLPVKYQGIQGIQIA